MRSLGHSSKLRRVSIALAATIALTGFVGPATSGAAAARPAAAAKRVVSARTSAQYAMPAPGMTTVQTITLPAGAWTVIAKAAAVNPSSADFVRCQIYDATNAVGLDGATYLLGGSATKSGSITNFATVVVGSGTVSLQHRCGHDSVAGNAAYLDSDASIVAFQTLDGTAAGQSIARTAGQTALTSTVATVLSLSLAPGTYALGFKMTAVTFSGDARVFCSMVPPGGYAGGAASDIGSPTAAATNAYVGYVSYSSSNFTVTLQCNLSGAAGAYLDPGTVLWARKATARTAVVGGCGAWLDNATTDLVALVRPGRICPITDSTTSLSQATIGKGTWVAVGGESTVVNNSGTADFARCELTIDGSHLDGTAAWELPGDDVGLTLLGTKKTTAGSTFSERCHRDTSAAESDSYSGSLVLIRV